MKISDVEIGAVYRYTYGGPATSAMNRHGPWLVGRVTCKMTNGRLAVDPVNGLPVARTRPPAGALLATPPANYLVPAARIDGRLCHSDNYDEWLALYLRQEIEATRARAFQHDMVRGATVGMVAALINLGCDVGVGPWDRSTRWGQLVDDLRRKEPDVVRMISLALQRYAGLDPGESSVARDAAEAWMVATIKGKETSNG